MAAQTYTDIPRLAGDPLIGSLRAFRGDRTGLLERVVDECGDIARLQIGRTAVVMVSEASAAHEVLVEKARAFVKSATLNRFARPLLGDGLITSEGDHHRRQRKIMAPYFPHARVATYASGVTELADHWLDGWVDGSELDVADEMTGLTLAIVTRTLFDLDVGPESEAIESSLTLANRYVNRLLQGLYHPPSWWPSPAAVANRRALRQLDGAVRRMIGARRAGDRRGDDLLTLLVEARDDDDGSGMTDDQLRDEVLTLMFAGHETTANALAWTWYALSRHPEVSAALRAEADRTLGGRGVALADLVRLPLALQVFKEALRLYPPVYLIGRRAEVAVTIGEYDLPAGTVVGVNVWGMHRRRDVFPDPQRFDPARFSPAREDAIPRSAYLPFGSGPRVCIGSQFALLEGHILVAMIARRFELEVLVRNLKPEPLITLRPRGGLKARIRRRLTAPVVHAD